MVDVFGPGAAHGQRAQEGLEFLKKGANQRLDGHLEVLEEGLKESGAQGEGDPQSQGSSGQDILERVGAAADLATRPSLGRVAKGVPTEFF